MMDVVAKNKDKIDISKLSKSLGCNVVENSALKNFGIDILIKKRLIWRIKNKL
jgi:ferrous iron transport protein B